MIYQGEPIGQWVCEKAGGTWTHVCQAVGQMKNDEIIAGVMYDGYTGSAISIHSRIDNPRKVSREFYWAAFDYPFNKLKVKVLRGLVSTANSDAQRLNLHLGFKEEARLKDYFPDGDGIVYVMRPENCRFLKLGERYAR